MIYNVDYFYRLLIAIATCYFRKEGRPSPNDGRRELAQPGRSELTSARKVQRNALIRLKMDSPSILAGSGPVRRPGQAGRIGLATLAAASTTTAPDRRRSATAVPPCLLQCNIRISGQTNDRAASRRHEHRSVPFDGAARAIRRKGAGLVDTLVFDSGRASMFEARAPLSPRVGAVQRAGVRTAT